MAMLTAYREKRQAEINSLSITAAIGWSGLFNGFSGEDGAKSHPRDLLPFTEKEPEAKKKVSDRTAEIIRSMAGDDRVPAIVQSQFLALLE